MASSPDSFVLVRAGARVCAVPIAAVIETMRPLPVAPVAGAPAVVRGVAIVRGEPVPVVELGTFLGAEARARPARFVTVRAGARVVALAVEGVVGVATLDARDAHRMPLLSDACAGAVEALRARDGELVVVLRTTRLVPDDVLRGLEAQGAPP